MTTRILAAALVLALLVPVSARSQAQEMKKEAKKMEHAAMGKGEMAPLKTFACPDPCNFSISSRDEKELSGAAIAHVKKHHNMTMTEKDVMGHLTSEAPKGEKK